MIKEEWKWEGH